ncbi:6-bladed beta-propeller [Oopsacas minuta]|uniref:6-bladed beta-propeller n=1 Tax=Oopsacas minuta TaxID=111878 RepID=A0AAV7JC20_9METZ|nr:6-bladed beta-propeller [Oopsacas minuta]
MSYFAKPKIKPAETNDNCLPVVKYKGKVTPFISVGREGTREGELKNPWGVTVDYKSGNIYVAEQSNDRIQVFDRGVYLYKFISKRMNSPLGLAISQERLFVTHYATGCLLVFNLNGELITQFSLNSKGKTIGHEETEFPSARGLALNESNGDLYVCNKSDVRVHIFSSDYLTQSYFGIGIALPLDIQVTKDCICVLSNRNPFLHTFDFNFTRIQNLISDSIYGHLKAPNGFYIDGAGNFIISNFSQDSVTVVDKDGSVLYKFTKYLKGPIGITLDSNSRILVVGHNNKLLIF